ncbi:YcaO-like family protein [Dactylosporangium sucinum]|uniref:Streptolysin associated protein SagD n=1 Tax=Dactylosporangium sucinum TaxID=1424081 RepID=A0A917UDG2_9ACTN|nr:YcaO-like family protein [Dactylosporangium sucinum]GGM78486.1 streptolysin associated protein SagD [Dactylosporangium sucinum]
MSALAHYPSMTRLMRRYRHLGGNQTGILPGYFFNVAEIPGEPWLRSMTATMPHYHRLIMNDPLKDVQYHLSGYSLYHEDAMIRMMGEAVERYAGMVAVRLFDQEFRYATFRELSREGECLPLEYLGMFSPEQQRDIGRLLHGYADRPPTEDDVIAWVRCPALTRPGEDLWVPAQMFFGGYTPSATHGDLLFTPSFSTGTAAHVSLENALRNALIEIVQLDSFILNWYTPNPCPQVVIDDDDVLRVLDTMRLGPDSDYRVKATYLTRPDLPLPTIAVVLDRKTDALPILSYGMQGDADPQRALLRAAMESAAILVLPTFSGIFDPTGVHAAANATHYLDLDSNVLFYASPPDADRKRAIFADRSSGSVKLSEIAPLSGSSTLESLIAMVAGVSRWATYLDVTPPELADTDWKVVRVLIPELLSMCLPGMPPKAHPRMVAHGGVTNDYPHPVP